MKRLQQLRSTRTEIKSNCSVLCDVALKRLRLRDLWLSKQLRKPAPETPLHTVDICLFFRVQGCLCHLLGWKHMAHKLPTFEFLCHSRDSHENNIRTWHNWPGAWAAWRERRRENTVTRRDRKERKAKLLMPPCLWQSSTSETDVFQDFLFLYSTFFLTGCQLHHKQAHIQYIHSFHTLRLRLREEECTGPITLSA